MMATRPGGQAFASCDEGSCRCVRRKGWFCDGLGFRAVSGLELVSSGAVACIDYSAVANATS